VIRILDQTRAPRSILELGLSAVVSARLEELLQRPTGIFLVTGPTGSGKSTTLYACLMKLHRPEIRILTAEDPVEYVYDELSQSEVNDAIGNTFAGYLRAFLRHDPEIIMIGEIRDQETAEMAFRAAQTGHLLLSTLHTNSAIAALPRLRRYARVLTGDPTRADDLVQDTLARAWTRRQLWEAGSNLRAWLFTIMHNVFVNQLALTRREAGNISLDAEAECGAVRQLPVYGNHFERIELREVVQQISRLPAEQREVLLLAAVEELRYDEIATALKIPIGTVMSRLSRARDKLRRMAVQPPAPLRGVR